VVCTLHPPPPQDKISALRNAHEHSATKQKVAGHKTAAEGHADHVFQLGVVHYESVPEVQTVSSSSYITLLLKCLRYANWQQTPEKMENDSILHNYNACCYISLIVQNLTKTNSQPLYSPHLAPHNFGNSPQSTLGSLVNV